MTDFLWWVFAALAVVGGVGMIAGRNPITSLLSLVLSFFSLASIYILLGAHFIGALQVIVYAGAIMVLFLFVIMLLNLGVEYHPDYRGIAWTVVGGVAAGTIGYFLWRTFGAPGQVVDQGGGELIDAALREHNVVGAIAFPLFREFLIPFELTSILLLVAIVGAVLLAKRRV